MSFNKKHPECGKDEVFITNSDSDGWPKIGWQTKRKGNVGYSTDGKPLSKLWPGAFPVFAKASEISAKDPNILAHLEA